MICGQRTQPTGLHPHARLRATETIERWHEEALAGLAEAMRRGGKSPRERELERELASLQKAFTDLAIRHELVNRALKDRPSKPGRSSR